MSSEKESYHTRIIAVLLDVVIIFFRHQRREIVCLADSNFKRQQTARHEMRRRRLDQFANHLVATHTAKLSAITPEPVPTSRMRQLALGNRHSPIFSTSCSVSGRGTRARLSQRKLWPANSTVPSKC